jgi:hypothetical protein
LDSMPKSATRTGLLINWVNLTLNKSCMSAACYHSPP